MIVGLPLFILFCVYTWAIFSITRSWKRLPQNEGVEAQRKVSVLIVYRNEEDNLPALLHSLQNQQFTKNNMELLFVNDHSTDNSVECINEWSVNSPFEVKNVNLGNGEYGKKTGIEKGVEIAQFDWILMCDADCTMEPLWVESMLHNGTGDFASGPVVFKSKTGMWNAFLQLDFMSLIVLGAALIQRKTPVIANGANMMFRKKMFIEIGGYAQNKKLASGDDVFLLSEMSKRTDRISFVKNQAAIVQTNPPKNISAFINQRIRWAKKSRYSTATKGNRIIQILTAFYMAYAVSIPLGFIIKSNVFWSMLLLVVLLKTVVDLLFFKDFVTFFDKKKLLPFVVLIQLFHPFYIVTIALLGVFQSYTWKERKIAHG